MRVDELPKSFALCPTPSRDQVTKASCRDASDSCFSMNILIFARNLEPESLKRPVKANTSGPLNVRQIRENYHG